MALSSSSLKTKIIAEIQAVFGAPADADQLAKFAEAIAKAVVSEITTNAVVNVTSVSGVTTGGGVSGSGTGTIS